MFFLECPNFFEKAIKFEKILPLFLLSCVKTSGRCFQIFVALKKARLVSGTSNIRSVLIGIEYCGGILNVYSLFVIWMGQIQSKLIYMFVTYGVASLLVTSL